MLARHFNTADRKSFRVTTRLYAGQDTAADLKRVLPAGPLLLVADSLFAHCETANALAPAARLCVDVEPKRRMVMEAWDALAGRDFKAVVALGGGSTIDTAKALHTLVSFGRLDMRDVERPAEAPALVAIPTTAGSGSEASRFFILSDDDGTKRSYRAWSFAPDVAVLDPAFLTEAGRPRLLLGAFDSFMHLWETYICRNERCPEAQMLALEGIALIAGALDRLAAGRTLDADALAGLQRASAYGGYAISNVRTGAVHTLAEGLAAQVPLGHPELLFVFFETVFSQYSHAVASETARLDRRLAAELGPGHSFALLRAQWTSLFEQAGISARIARALETTPVDFTQLGTSLARDTVLHKEHPVAVTPEDLTALAAARLEPRAALRSKTA